jgi:hypothetical protein
MLLLQAMWHATQSMPENKCVATHELASYQEFIRQVAQSPSGSGHLPSGSVDEHEPSIWHDLHRCACKQTSGWRLDRGSHQCLSVLGPCPMPQVPFEYL